jgi:hypothetical protein
MGTRIVQIVLLCLAGQLFAVSGCYSTVTTLAKSSAKYKESRSLSCDFKSDSRLVVRNECGPITVSPGDIQDCQIEARVYVLAPRKAEAREIGQAVQVRADPNDGMVRVVVDTPHLENKQHVWVDLKVRVPQEARGALDLETEAGRIACRKITSQNVVAKSSFGAIDITCSEACPADVDADLETEFGKVRFKAPPDFQGEIDLGTEFGSTRTAIPIVQGESSRDSKKGSTGDGNGRLRLHTSFGSVRLR